MVAECDDFKKRLKEEQEHLYAFSEEASVKSLLDKEDKQYRVTWRDKLIRKVFKYML